MTKGIPTTGRIANGAIKRFGKKVPTAWFVKGVALEALRRPDQARIAFNRYLKLDPNGRHADRVKQQLTAHQMLAEDYLRMYVAKLDKMEVPEPFQPDEEVDKTLAVLNLGTQALFSTLGRTAARRHTPHAWRQTARSRSVDSEASRSILGVSILVAP